MKKAMKNFYKYFAYFCGILFIFLLLVEIVDNSFYYKTNRQIFTNWQLPLVHSIYLILIAIVSYALYKKYFFFIILIFVLVIGGQRSGIIWEKFDDFRIIRDKILCDDIGYCKEISFSWINEKSCLEKGYAWNIEDKGCQTFFQEEDCFRLEGNWIYPEVCEQNKILNNAE